MVVFRVISQILNLSTAGNTKNFPTDGRKLRQILQIVIITARREFASVTQHLPFLTHSRFDWVRPCLCPA